jgi:hypothetical protein
MIFTGICVILAAVKLQSGWLFIAGILLCFHSCNED